MLSILTATAAFLAPASRLLSAPARAAVGTKDAPAQSIFSPVSESVATAKRDASAPVPAVVGTAIRGSFVARSVATGAL